MIDRDDRLCALCGQGGEDVRGNRSRGWTGGDAAPSGRYLVTLPGKTYRNENKKLFDNGEEVAVDGRFHAFHEVELGPKARANLGLASWQSRMTCGELAKLYSERANPRKNKAF